VITCGISIYLLSNSGCISGSLYLESYTLDLNNAVPLLESSKEYAASPRDQFDLLEEPSRLALKVTEKSKYYKAVDFCCSIEKRSVPLTRFHGSASEVK